MQAKNDSIRQRLSWSHWKISAKITAIVLATLILTTAAFIVSSFYINSNQNNQAAGERLVSLADQALMRAAEKVTGGVQVLQTLAMNQSIVEAVQAANAARSDWTPEKVAGLDKAWIDGDPTIKTIQNEIAGNPLSAYLKSFVKANPSEVEVFVTDEKGLNVSMTDKTSDFLQGDEGWWKSAFNNGNGAVFVDKVAYDESTKAYAMNIGVPVLDPATQKTIGILRGTLDVSIVISVLGEIKVGDTSAVMLVDADGNVLYSPDSVMLNKPAPTWLADLLKIEKSGWSFSQDISGRPAFAGYSHPQGDMEKALGWRLVITQSVAEVNQSLASSLLVSLVTGAAVALLALLIGLRVIRSVTKPIVSLTNNLRTLAGGDLDLESQNLAYLENISHRQDEVGAMCDASLNLLGYMQEMVGSARKVASGDLTVSVRTRSERDELGNAFAMMVANLLKLVRQVSENARKLNESSSQMAVAAEQAGSATSQIAETIQQLTQGAIQQSEAVNKTAGSVDQMSHMIDSVSRGAQEQTAAMQRASKVTKQISSAIEQVAGNTQVVKDDSNHAADAARAGFRTVEDTVSGMQSIKAKVDLSATKVQEMGSRSDQIGAIVETIEDIASQTNLLALNAAIEAARAGEHGKGFAVVADEVRKLAERASSSTKEINGLVKSIQTTVSEAIAAMNESAREVDAGVVNANKAGEALKAILEASESVNQQALQASKATEQMASASKDLVQSVDTVATVVNQNASATDQMAVSSTDVTHSIENIASISEENSASFEEVAASTEEMNAQVDMVTQSAASLADMAQALQQVVDQFVIGQQAAAVSVKPPAAKKVPQNGKALVAAY